MTLHDWLIVIPARLESQRLANKPLQKLGGKHLIHAVYDNLSPLSREGATIVVALDSTPVRDLCEKEKIPYKTTNSSHPSGTDRCNEVTQGFRHKYVMNVQGDEPFVNLDDLRRLAEATQSSGASMATLGMRSLDPKKFQDPNIVKIVMNSREQAIYFSRAPVPFDREALRLGSPVRPFWLHMGIYAFTRDGLAEFCRLPHSALEDSEKLEQLRAISAGWPIMVSEARHPSFGIDTAEDLLAAEKMLAPR